jgi:Flp pilus assembly protein CpaB
VLAAVIAGALILVYVNRYRDSLRTQSAPVTVLVANTTITKGTAGKIVAAKSLFTVTTLRESQLLNGAISDPSSLIGRAASRDIYKGEQLTAADFAGSATSLPSTLTDTERAITIPLDAAHGLIGQLHAGDHVDVYAGFNIVPVGPTGIPLAGGQGRPALRMIMSNIPVVTVSGSKAGGVVAAGPNSSNVTLKVSGEQASELAFASDNGKIWLSLRPSSGAAAIRPELITAETLLLGIPPITIAHALGGRG